MIEDIVDVVQSRLHHIDHSANSETSEQYATRLDNVLINDTGLDIDSQSV